MIGRIYEVYVNGQPVRLIGSTQRSLIRRRSSGYTKRFGHGVELKLIREIHSLPGYDAHGFNFHLKACEAMEIARRKTYREDGGLNKMSPLVQALDFKTIESEIGRIGGLSVSHETHVRAGKSGGPESWAGKLRGAKCRDPKVLEAKRRGAIKAGSLTRDRKVGFFALDKEVRRAASRRGGNTTAARGLLGRGVTEESRKRAYENGIGKMTKEEQIASGKKAAAAMLAKNPKGNGPQVCCLRWNIRRGKPCVCGKHLEQAAA